MTAISALVGRPVRPLDNTVNGMRLTLESGQPVSVSNQNAKTTLYLTPYISNRLALYYDSKWNIYETAEVSLSLSSLTASTAYDIFAYWSGSAVVLEALAWSTLTARATAIVRQDGVWVKSGDATRRYIGTIIINASGGQTDDAYTKRFVWNLQNRVKRPCWTTNTTNSWTYATAANREHNNGTGQLRFEFVCGLDSYVNAENHGRLTMGGASTGGYLYVSIDAVNPPNNFDYIDVYTDLVRSGVRPFYNVRLATVGYHYITQVEYAYAGTVTNWGSGSATNCGYGAKVDWES